jgi:hypothetical protein
MNLFKPELSVEDSFSLVSFFVVPKYEGIKLADGSVMMGPLVVIRSGLTDECVKKLFELQDRKNEQS